VAAAIDQIVVLFMMAKFLLDHQGNVARAHANAEKA
jgi:hypothetical protein